MAITAFMYGNCPLTAYAGEIDLSGAVRAMLCTVTYTPNQDTHDYKNDVTNEVVGAGYTARGELLANKTMTYTGGTNVYMFDNTADITWSSSTITARYAVIYRDTTVDATSALICYFDFGEDFSSSNGNFVLQFNASGIFTITVS